MSSIRPSQASPSAARCHRCAHGTGPPAKGTHIYIYIYIYTYIYIYIYVSSAGEALLTGALDRPAGHLPKHGPAKAPLPDSQLLILGRFWKFELKPQERLHLVSTTPPLAECRSFATPRALRGICTIDGRSAASVWLSTSKTTRAWLERTTNSRVPSALKDKACHMSSVLCSY